MRVPLWLLPTMLLVACGQAPQAPVAEAVPPRLDFPGKQRIPVRLHLRGGAEGRGAAIAGAWRGDVEFDGGDRSRCAIDRGDLPALEPGSSHEVRLVCGSAVRLPGDGSRGFRVTEDGREVASGTVLP